MVLLQDIISNKARGYEIILPKLVKADASELAQLFFLGEYIIIIVMFSICTEKIRDIYSVQNLGQS